MARGAKRDADDVSAAGSLSAIAAVLLDPNANPTEIERATRDAISLAKEIEDAIVMGTF